MSQSTGSPNPAGDAGAGATGDARPGHGLGVTAARGIAWIGGGQFFRQLLGIGTSIVLARLLAPEDFGLIAMAFVFVGLAQVFADFGIGAALMQTRDTDPQVISSTFWAGLAVGVIVALVTALSAPAIASFYGDGRLLYLVYALSLTLLLASAFPVPRALLYREMRFRQITQAQIAGSLAGSVTAVALAWSGFGVWALVWQPICGSGVSFVLMYVFTGWRPSLTFSWSRIRHLTSYGFDVLGADLLFRVKQDGDKLIIGKLLGSTFLGYYSLAFQIMLYPVTYVAAVIARVLFPTLSLLQNERDRLRLACLKAAGAVAFVTFPIMAGLFVVADDFVTTVFGTKWAPMIPLLRILCVVGALESIGATASTIFLSTGETRKMLRIALVSAPLTLVALALGLPWGLVGVTTSFALASVVFVYVNLHFALKVVGIRIRDLHFALLGPIATSAIMAVTVWFVKWVARSNFEAQTTIRLLLCVGTGVCVYALANLSFNRTQLMALWRLAIASARRQGVVET